MFCDYKVNSIVDHGNQTEVICTFYEGDYQDVDVNGEIVNQYVRTNVFHTATLWFEKSPVQQTEIEAKLKKLLDDVKNNREVIPECI